MADEEYTSHFELTKATHTLPMFIVKILSKSTKL